MYTNGELRPIDFYQIAMDSRPVTPENNKENAPPPPPAPIKFFKQKFQPSTQTWTHYR